MDIKEANRIMKSAEVRDRKALKEEAKSRIREYLDASPEDQWSLTTLTYRHKFDKAGFLIEAMKWKGLIRGFKVERVKILSGVQVIVYVRLTFTNGRSRTVMIPMTKEADIRTPDIDASLGVDGRNAPPFYQVHN